MCWIWCVRVVLLPGSAHHLEVMGSEGLCPKVSPVHPAVQGHQQATRQVCRWGECCKSTPAGLLPEPMCNCVTKKIGTLCVCCCILYFALSMFFCVWTSFNLLWMFYVLLFWISLKDVVRERERRQEAIPTASHRYHQKRKKNKTEIVCCYLLPTCYFHRPFTHGTLLTFSKIYGLGGQPSPMNTDVKSGTFT